MCSSRFDAGPVGHAHTVLPLLATEIPIASDLYDLFLRVVRWDIPGIPLLERIFGGMLDWMHGTLGLSWLIGIALLASMMRLTLAPLTVRGKQTTLRMIAIRPFVERVIERHPDDRAAQSQAMGELLDHNRIRMWRIVLPIFLQMPIFVALYRVMLNSAMTDASRVPIFGNLSVPVMDGGPAGITLVLVMAVTQVLMVRMLAMRKEWWFVVVSTILAAIQVPFVVNFPVGVILFIVVTQMLVVTEQALIVRFIDFNTTLVDVEDENGHRPQVTVDLARAWRSGQLEQVARDAR